MKVKTRSSVHDNSWRSLHDCVSDVLRGVEVSGAASRARGETPSVSLGPKRRRLSSIR